MIVFSIVCQMFSERIRRASVLNRFGLDVDVAFDVPAGEERRAGQLHAREPLSRGSVSARSVWDRKRLSPSW